MNANKNRMIRVNFGTLEVRSALNPVARLGDSLEFALFALFAFFADEFPDLGSRGTHERDGTNDTAERLARLEHIVEDLLKPRPSARGQRRRGRGGSDAGLEVSVRLGEVETVEHTRDNGLGITVYFGHRKGSASTSDLSPGGPAGRG
jgi:hypothetical protein